MDGIHQVCQTVTLLGGESATMTLVAHEPRVKRCVFQHFETRREIRFWSERHGMQRCNPGAAAYLVGYGSESGPPVWSSPNGRARTNANAFREELIKFDRELIAAMQRTHHDLGQPPR